MLWNKTCYSNSTINCRVTSSSTNTHTFDTNFLIVLFSTSASHWVEIIGQAGINIFDYNVLLFIFDASGHKTLFLVLGGKKTRSYTCRRFKDSRPCIIHFDPNNQLCGRHDHHAIADKLRTWLNKLWRSENTENDRMIMPFNKRSMPSLQPYGTLLQCRLLLYL